MSDIVFYIFLFFAIAYMAVLCYYLVALLKVKKYNPPKAINHSVFISVIVPARNEAEQISYLLQSLEKQRYDHRLFEVIVVNDHSTDNTAEVVSKYLNEQFKLIHLSEYVEETKVVAFKKKAIEVGISVARGELIVTTDADCEVPEKWLQTIAGYYAEHGSVWMVMPVHIHPARTLLQRFQSLDFMMLQAITAGAVSNNIHTMCNGANLAYTKKAFYEVGGFTGIDGVASGDDMLLMEKMKEKYPDKIGYIFSKNVMVETKPVQTAKDFLHQRIRWAGKSKLYKEKNILPIMFLVYFFNLLIMAGAALYLTHQISIILFSTVLFIKMIAEFFLLLPMTKFFGSQKQLWMFPFFQPIHILYTIAAGSFGMMRRHEWKGRSNK